MGGISGDINIAVGSAGGNRAGSLRMHAGVSTSLGQGGSVDIQGGSSLGNPGNIALAAGSSEGMSIEDMCT